MVNLSVRDKIFLHPKELSLVAIVKRTNCDLLCMHANRALDAEMTCLTEHVFAQNAFYQLIFGCGNESQFLGIYTM